MTQKILLCNDFLSSITFILLTETLLTHMAFLYNLVKGPLFQDTFSPLVRNLSDFISNILILLQRKLDCYWLVVFVNKYVNP